MILHLTMHKLLSMFMRGSIISYGISNANLKPQDLAHVHVFFSWSQVINVDRNTERSQTEICFNDEQCSNSKKVYMIRIKVIFF